MKTIEDCLETLDKICATHPYSPPPGYRHPTTMMSQWDYRFVNDVSIHTLKGSPLSTKQAETLIKVLSRNIKLFDPKDQTEVAKLIREPSYRRPLHTTVEIKREVRWAGGPTILFRFPYNPAIVADLKAISYVFETIHTSIIAGPRLHKVIVDSGNYKHIMNLIQKHSFAFDDETLHFFMNVNNHADAPNTITVGADTIDVAINNDVMATLWLENMEWLTNV